MANIGTSEAGLVLVPGARSRSGDLRIGVVKANTLLSFIHLLIMALFGRVEFDPQYTLFEGREVVIVPQSRPRAFECDGDRFPPTRKLIIRILPRSLAVLCPSGS